MVVAAPEGADIIGRKIGDYSGIPSLPDRIDPAFVVFFAHRAPDWLADNTRAGGGLAPSVHPGFLPFTTKTRHSLFLDGTERGAALP